MWVGETPGATRPIGWHTMRTSSAAILTSVVVVCSPLASGCSNPPAHGNVGPDADDAQADDVDASTTDAPEELAGDASGEGGIEMLGNLPPAPATPPHADAFMGSVECNFCHAQGTGVLTDARGGDISPTNLFRRSMMTHSARDPYWLAQLSHERIATPAADAEIRDICTRCHAPVANELARRAGTSPTFEALTTGTTAVDHLGREGVTCTVCHQITAEGLGTEASFVGGYVLGTERQIFGPHADPFTNPMRMHLDYTPTEAGHVMQSELCATCHTVITDALDASGVPTGSRFAEQVPYLEWRNSSAAAEGTTCQACHSPRVSPDGETYATILSLRPPSLTTVRPVGVHTFTGGNANMLEALAANREWAGVDSSAAELLEAAAAADIFLAAAIDLTVASVDGTRVTFRVTNGAGHKFPTAYPTRRAWLEVVGYDASGAETFHSGASDASGFIVNPDGTREGDDPRPHYDVIDDPSQVQVWQGIMADDSGSPTHTLLRGARWWKDDRLLPVGWSTDHPDAAMTAPVGVEGDANFVPGSDEVTYILPTGTVRAEARLLYQTVPPTSARALDRDPTPASRRFVDVLSNAPPEPRRVGAVEVELSP